MYENALIAHNFMRWIALLFVLFAFVRALSGWMGDRPRNTLDRTVAMIAMIAVDLQLLIGLLMWALWSPEVKAARESMGTAMKDANLRYWLVEHPTFMLLAIALVHVGKIMSNKAKTPRGSHGRGVFCFGIALALMIFGTPWPNSSTHPRPWFRT
jgi:hypothetical protein